MAKEKKRRKAQSMTIPLAAVAGFLPLTFRGVAGFREGGLEGAAHQLIMGTTGYDHREMKWRGPALAQGMGPILAGLLVHKLATKLGVNRALGNAGVPFIRI